MILNNEFIFSKSVQKKIERILKYKKIAIVGAGSHTQYLLKHFHKLKDKYILIFSEQKDLKSIEGIEIKPESELRYSDFDIIIISSQSFEKEIFKRLVKKNIPYDKLILLYSSQNSFFSRVKSNLSNFKSIFVKVIIKILRCLSGIFFNFLGSFVSYGIQKNLVNLNDIQKIFNNKNIDLLKSHYYSPIPDKDDLKFANESKLPGINIDENKCYEFLENVVLKYKEELNSLPINKQDDSDKFYLINGNFMAIDSNVYYSLIRHIKPQKIIEIGSGNSTLLASEALLKNHDEGNSSTQLICIEPYRGKRLRKKVFGLTQLIEKKVQEVPLKIFESLGENDILFIDSSHVLRIGNDVWFEFCEILPRLKSGVFVHIHDISLPKPYPNVYFEEKLYFNEQYLLQTFLTFNNKFDIIWPGNYLMTKNPQKIRNSFLPEYDLMRESYPFSEPTSFWMKVK